MTLDDLKQLAVPAFIAIGTTLLMGRTLRRLILLPFEWLARNTENKIDDQIVSDATQDLGIDPTKFEDK